MGDCQSWHEDGRLDRHFGKTALCGLSALAIHHGHVKYILNIREASALHCTLTASQSRLASQPSTGARDFLFWRVLETAKVQTAPRSGRAADQTGCQALPARTKSATADSPAPAYLSARGSLTESQSCSQAATVFSKKSASSMHI